MTCPGFSTRIAGRLVVVRTGTKTQTVNMCTKEDKGGLYDLTLRLPIAVAILDTDLPPLATLGSLRD